MSELNASVDVDNNGNAKFAVDGFNPEQPEFEPSAVVGLDDANDDDDASVASTKKDFDSTDGSELNASVDVDNNGNAKFAMDGFNPDQSAFDPGVVVDDDDGDTDGDDNAEIIEDNPGSGSPEFETAAAAAIASDNASDAVVGNCKLESFSATGDERCHAVCWSQLDVHVDEFDEVDDSGVTDAGNRSDRIPDVIVEDLDSTDSSVVESLSSSIDPVAPDQCSSDRDLDLVMPGICSPSFKQ